MISRILSCLGLAACLTGYAWVRWSVWREREELRRALREEHRRARRADEAWIRCRRHPGP